MLSVSTGHSAGYLTGSVGGGMEGYYTGAVGAGEPPGRWTGAGAKLLGLEGEVDAEVMSALYDRFLDPRDAKFADPDTRTESGVLGRAAKRFRTPEQIVDERIREYTKEQASTPTPEQIRGWRIEAESKAQKAVHFFDATFSPVKSVTVLHTAFARAAHEAAAAGESEKAAEWQAKVQQIDDAMHEANDYMLGYLAEVGGYARTGRHTGQPGTGRWVDSHDLTVASFYQHTSRDHDPQLHIHNAVLNRVPCPDGTWRSLDGRALHSGIQGAGAIASAVLQTRLTESLGLSWEPREDGNDFEVKGVDQDVMDLFSSRTRTLTAHAQKTIEQAEATLGRPLNSLQRSRLMKEASLRTRLAKTHDSETEAERLERWNAMLEAEVAGSVTRLADYVLDLELMPVQQFSAEAVIAEALEAVHGADDGSGRSVWGASDLMRRIHLALPPNLGISAIERIELMRRLTDTAIEQAVLVSGREVGDVPCPDRLDNGLSAAAAPYQRRYATPGHLAAEVAVLESIGLRGRRCVAEKAVTDWIDASASTLTSAQRAAVVGIATSDAAMAVMVGPAGTGKSFTAGALAAMWAELSDGGRVIGLATAENAARVLMDDGITDSANIAAFLTAQSRLAGGRGVPGDERWQLGAGDIVAIDEASMLDTYRLGQLRQIVEDHGARLVLMGDPHQLAAVGAGGMMRTVVDRGAETYTLSEVRRFAAEWEREASLQLREGDGAAVPTYDRYGRLRDAGTLDQAIASLARAAAADRLAGQSVLVTCGSNENAAAVSAGIRRYMVEAGIVQEGGTLLGRDRNTAGVGDIVQARRIDRGLGLINRETYEVTGVREDGDLDVTSARTGKAMVMPAEYVEADVSLAYASTAHAAEGATVDVGHVLFTNDLDRAAAYVGMTRGRQTNQLWAVTVDTAADPNIPPGTARGMLDELLASASDLGPTGDLSAVDVEALDDAQRSSPSVLLSRIEEQTQLACRQRLENDLDALVAEGILDEDNRARFGAEQGSEHLARQLRALEHAGLDPAQVLREAVTSRNYEHVVSVSQATAARIDHKYGLPTVVSVSTAPERVEPARVQYLTALRGVLDTRQVELGERLAAEPPAWAVAVLGAVPAADQARAEWAAKAGQIGAVREATSWNHPSLPLGRAPGVSTPERRAEWTRAWTVAGMPEEKRPAADLTDGQIRVRIAAGERVLAHAPLAVYDLQRQYEQDAANLAREAVLARSQGRVDVAAGIEARVMEVEESARRLDETNTIRAEWLLANGETLRVFDEAKDESIRRGLVIDREPDRAPAEDWLAAQRAAELAEDATREVTEADLVTEEVDVRATEAELAAAPLIAYPSDALDNEPPNMSAEATAAEIAAVAAHAAHQRARLTERAAENDDEIGTVDGVWHSAGYTDEDFAPDLDSESADAHEVSREEDGEAYESAGLA
jgi:conjugative relaxase-like TrwC/TraI family protein